MQLRRERLRLLLAWALLLLPLTGCDPGAGGMTPDADAGMADADVGFEVLPPNIDWLDAGVPPIAAPSFTPCPEGWREVGGDEEGTPITCAPYPEGGPDECVDGWVHFVGAPGCTPVGAPCPLGDFPEGLPSDQPALYVLAGASAGGDGSEGGPLGTIAEAMGLASPGTVIALGKGVYDEVVYLAAGVTLWGACTAETRLTASSPSVAVRGVVQVFAADTRLQNVGIGPAEISGLAVVGARAEVTIEGVLIEGTGSAGLTVTDGGRVGGHTLTVSDTQADSAGLRGFGILVQTRGTVELARVLLSRNRHTGVFVLGAGTSATLTDLVVRDTQSQESDRAVGRGLGVELGATAEVTRALFEGNREHGILVGGGGASVTATDLVVRDTQSQESDQTFGRGLGVMEGATAEVTRALVERNREVGVLVSGVGTSLTLTDVVVRDTQAQESDRTVGTGLAVIVGATADVTRALFARNRAAGILAMGVDVSMTLTDLVVRDTQSEQADGAAGSGLDVRRGATAEVTRALLERNRTFGVLVVGDGASATLTDLVVRDTQSRESDGEDGAGLSAVVGATAEVTRALFARNRAAGIIGMGSGTSLTLTDLVARDAQGRERDGAFGRGLTLQGGAAAEVTRALFARNREFGVIAINDGTTTRLIDVVVEETAEQRCARTTCPERPYGVGLASVLAGAMTATRFALAGSALCGVFLASGGALDLSIGHVSGSPIGVCLQVNDYPLTRLTDGVRYVGNGTNLEATTLPVPELSPSTDFTR